MPRMVCIALLLALFCPGAAFSQENAVTATETWRSLPLVEDGKIASGWTFTGFGEFEVVDDFLRAAPDERGLGLLYYDKEKFGDCRIRVVFRTEKPESNSGVYLRIDDGLLTAKQALPAERNPDGSLTEAGEKALVTSSEQALGPWYAVHHGFEVQICDSADPSHGTGAIYSLARTKPLPPKPGQWRTMVVTLAGDQVTVEMDGETVTTFDSSDRDLPPREQWYEPRRKPKRPQSGYIGLQTHDPGDVVDFKEVSIQKL